MKETWQKVVKIIHIMAQTITSNRSVRAHVEQLVLLGHLANAELQENQHP